VRGDRLTFEDDSVRSVGEHDFSGIVAYEHRCPEVEMRADVRVVVACCTAGAETRHALGVEEILLAVSREDPSGHQEEVPVVAEAAELPTHSMVLVVGHLIRRARTPNLDDRSSGVLQPAVVRDSSLTIYGLREVEPLLPPVDEESSVFRVSPQGLVQELNQEALVVAVLAEVPDRDVLHRATYLAGQRVGRRFEIGERQQVPTMGVERSSLDAGVAFEHLCPAGCRGRPDVDEASTKPNGQGVGVEHLVSVSRPRDRRTFIWSLWACTDRGDEGASVWFEARVAAILLCPFAYVDEAAAELVHGTEAIEEVGHDRIAIGAVGGSTEAESVDPLHQGSLIDERDRLHTPGHADRSSGVVVGVRQTVDEQLLQGQRRVGANIDRLRALEPEGCVGLREEFSGVGEDLADVAYDRAPDRAPVDLDGDRAFEREQQLTSAGGMRLSVCSFGRKVELYEHVGQPFPVDRRRDGNAEGVGNGGQLGFDEAPIKPVVRDRCWLQFCGRRGRGLRHASAASRAFVELGHQLVEAVDGDDHEVRAHLRSEVENLRVQFVHSSSAPVDAMRVVPGGLGAVEQEVLHDRGLGTPVADHDKRVVLEQRVDGDLYVRVHGLRLVLEVAVRVVLDRPVNMHDLGRGRVAGYQVHLERALDGFDQRRSR